MHPSSMKKKEQEEEQIPSSGALTWEEKFLGICIAHKTNLHSSINHIRQKSRTWLIHTYTHFFLAQLIMGNVDGFAGLFTSVG